MLAASECEPVREMLAGFRACSFISGSAVPSVGQLLVSCFLVLVTSMAAVRLFCSSSLLALYHPSWFCDFLFKLFNFFLSIC